MIAAAVAVPALVFLVEVAAGLADTQDAGSRADRRAPRTAVIMPAHEEARTIHAVLERLLPALPPGIDLIVVADNCTDATANEAARAGARVIQRHDPARRGKGYALAFARDALALDPPEVAVVLDADCFMVGADLARLAGEAAASGRPVQARYRFGATLDAPPMVQISSFALLVKNMVRQRGAARLGAPALLTGTGMALPWCDFAAAPLATGDLVEDLALTVALAEAGSAPRYLDTATVESAASTEGGTLVQRTRWEHGFIGTARRHGLPLLLGGIRRGRGGLVWLGLHLMTPPLALLVMMLGGALVLTTAAAACGATRGPAWLTGVLLTGIAAAVLLAWARHGREAVAASTLLRLPGYLLWKLPIYLKLARGAETRWVRTERVD